jgi:hypothetical protein
MEFTSLNLENLSSVDKLVVDGQQIPRREPISV